MGVLFLENKAEEARIGALISLCWGPFGYSLCAFFRPLEKLPGKFGELPGEFRVRGLSRSSGEPDSLPATRQTVSKYRFAPGWYRWPSTPGVIRAFQPLEILGKERSNHRYWNTRCLSFLLLSPSFIAFWAHIWEKFPWKHLAFFWGRILPILTPQRISGRLGPKLPFWRQRTQPY